MIRPAVAEIPVFGNLPTADAIDPVAPAPALLHLNECPYPPSPRVIEAIRSLATGVNRYAEPRPIRLAGMLAERTGIGPDRIVIANGSDEILALTALATLEPGDNAVMPTPSFPRYRQATLIQGAEPRLVRNLADGRNDVDGLLAAVDGSTRVVFACSPNNPSGPALAAAEIVRLIEATPADVLLVLDEAYAEFDRFEGGVETLPLLARRRGPWLATRTFSKAYALAGLRIGYGLASDTQVAEALLRVKLNFNLNRLAVHAAIAALDEEAYARDCIAKAVGERERLAGLLRSSGLRPLASRANFVSLDLGRNAVPVMAAMAKRGVLVREWRDPGYETFIRISVGLPPENDLAFSELRRALERDAPE
jgi:histidinol-phosphate aminotransferase